MEKLQLEEVERVQSVQRSVDAANRIYDFNDEINGESVYQLMHTLSAWTRQSTKPIVIRFNSPGGEVINGFTLYDYIRAVAARDKSGKLIPANAIVNQETGVITDKSGQEISTRGVFISTTALGMAASMAGIVLQAGNRRVVAPNAWVLIHELTAGTRGNLQKMKDDLKFIESLREKGYDILTERSTLTKKEIQDMTAGREFYMSPEEILKYKLADEIGYF